MKKEIKIGCCGFPISKKEYYKQFCCIEINSTFYQIPSIKSAEKWRKERENNNPDFEFIIKAWQIITHKYTSFTYRRLKEKFGDVRNYGFFFNTSEVYTAWNKMKEFAYTLGCKKILFQCPASFEPKEENIKNLCMFFKKTYKDRKRYKFDFIIEFRGEKWDETVVKNICKEFDLIHCVDPLYNKSFYGRYRYYRLHGLHIDNKLDYNYKFSLEDLKKVLSLCDKRLNYVMFNNSNMYEDAKFFKELI